MIKFFEKYRFKINSIIYNYIFKENKNNFNINRYWDFRFNKFRYHHSRQNILIAQDFINNILNKSKFLNVLKTNKTLLEIGCGTGEFSQIIHENFKNIDKIIATDISDEAIRFANKHNKYKNIIQYIKFNSFEHNNSFELLGKFDIVLCSNVLEHFKNPYELLNQMKIVSKYMIIIVPYNHLSIDTVSKGEGGEGHVFCFTENSFKDYHVLDSIKFKSKGWQNVKEHPNPLQFAVLIKS